MQTLTLWWAGMRLFLHVIGGKREIEALRFPEY